MFLFLLLGATAWAQPVDLHERRLLEPSPQTLSPTVSKLPADLLPPPPLDLTIAFKVRDIGVPGWTDIYLPGWSVAVLGGPDSWAGETAGGGDDASVTFSLTDQLVYMLIPGDPLPGYEHWDGGMSVPMSGALINDDFYFGGWGDMGYVTDGVVTCWDDDTGVEIPTSDPGPPLWVFFDPPEETTSATCEFEVFPTRPHVMDPDPKLTIFSWLVIECEGAWGPTPSPGGCGYDVQPWTLSPTFAEASSAAGTMDVLPGTQLAPGRWQTEPWHFEPDATEKVTAVFDSMPPFLLEPRMLCRPSADVGAFPDLNLLYQVVGDELQVDVLKDGYPAPFGVDQPLDINLYCYLQGTLIAP